MKIKAIKKLTYEYGYEQSILPMLYKSKEPILIKIKNFTDKFNLDYFIERFNQQITYSIFENNIQIDERAGDLTSILNEIKNNKPYRIFGICLPLAESSSIESHIPLWKKIPLRPRFFRKDFKVGYYFGGKGAHTEMHYDRKHSCNLHICLSGKKELLLFTQDQSDAIYKVPFISNSLINFGYPLSQINKEFPRLREAEGYRIILEQGDMLFMPRNCWHYTTYMEPSASATYAFYPKKLLHIVGYFTGHFFLGYKNYIGLAQLPFFQKFSEYYAHASGIKKIGFKCLEKFMLYFLFFPVSIYNIIKGDIRFKKK